MSVCVIFIYTIVALLWVVLNMLVMFLHPPTSQVIDMSWTAPS